MDIILENIICKDYLELGLGTTKLAKKYNVTKDFCKKIIHKRKLMRNQYEPNCVFDIWTEESAYFYGLLMSDGSFRKTKDSREKNKKSDFTYEIRLRMIDLEIIEKFCDFLSLPRFRIKFEYSTTPKGNKSKLYCINYSNRYLCNQLEKIGLPTGKKSAIVAIPSTLPNDLLSHLIRGYYDGDGTVGIYTNKNNRILHRFGICSMNKKLLEFFLKSIPVEAGYIQTIKRNFYNLFYSTHRDNFVTIRNYLYKDATVFLERKRNIFFSI